MNCTMCAEREATTTWGAPVCQPCHDMLVGLQADLDQEEEANPALKEAGRRVADAARKFIEDNP